MVEKLNGRLEMVKIEKQILATDNCNYGELLRDKRKVTVRNALSYEGRPCLVRFDLRDGLYRPEPTGYFISSVVPPSFVGLAAEQYILMGLWEKEASSKSIPTLPEIEEAYRPGNMPFYRYFQKGFSNQQGIYLVINTQIQADYGTSLARYIRRIDSSRAARVLIVEAETDLEKIMMAVKDQHLSPIIMELLRDR